MSRNDELAEQIKIFNWARYVDKRPELALLHSIPNGGYRAIGEASRLKASGVLAGVPDICLPVARGGYHGLYIELKTSTGRVSADQKIVIARLQEQGYQVEICRGAEEAIDTIKKYLGAL